MQSNRLTLLSSLAATALIAGAVAVASIAASAAVAPGVAQAADRDCSDFKNQKRAQRFFKKHNPRRDPHGLDADGDRIACETLPCPCSRKARRQLSASTAYAAAGQRCINLRYDGTRYVFYKRGMGCGKARSRAKHVQRTNGRWEPAGFRCRSGTNFRRDGACQATRRKFFLWYPEH